MKRNKYRYFKAPEWLIRVKRGPEQNFIYEIRFKGKWCGGGYIDFLPEEWAIYEISEEDLFLDRI